MIDLTTDNKADMLAWAAGRIGIERFFADAKPVGVLRRGELCAVIVYDRFTDLECNMHVAALPGYWLTRRVVRAAFWFPFVQYGFKRVTALVASKNLRARKLDEHLGFKYEGLAREAAPGDDLIIYGMLRRECRFITKEERNA